MSEVGFCKVRNVYKATLAGTYVVVAAISLLSLVSFALGYAQAPGVVATCFIAALYVGFVYTFARLNYLRIVAYMLVAFYMLLAVGTVATWGINTPLGLLLFCVVIVLAGILLTASHALWAGLMTSLVLVGLQTLVVLRWYTPDMSWTIEESSYGDALAYCIIFGMIALVSWLYNCEMERSLREADQAEKALSRQKSVLRERVRKRTDQLHQSQLEEMQQMYRFAELGQLGVALLHDLANHLTSLNLEIEGIQNRQNSDALARARQITGYLEKMVVTTRAKLNGETQQQGFDIVQKINDVTNFLEYKAAKAKVEIDWEPPPGNWIYTGDPTCFCQMIAIVANNAIDAYGTVEGSRQQNGANRLTITLQRRKTYIAIKISDWGKGIPKNRRKHLFKLFHSSKKSGLGIGLFIARQTVESNFGGTIALNPRSKHTEFIIKLPVQKND